MPLLPGKTLDKLIKTGSHRLTLERSVDIISQVCRGLQAAHERGLVHRDLKPSNIFVMQDDSVRIIDGAEAAALQPRRWRMAITNLRASVLASWTPKVTLIQILDC
jgi:serine/threonine protein kinase